VKRNIGFGETNESARAAIATGVLDGFKFVLRHIFDVL
jgi:hypothetical protein